MWVSAAAMMAAAVHEHAPVGFMLAVILGNIVVVVGLVRAWDRSVQRVVEDQRARRDAHDDLGVPAPGYSSVCGLMWRAWIRPEE